jgi:hypothetical protein
MESIEDLMDGTARIWREFFFKKKAQSFFEGTQNTARIFTWKKRLLA